MSQDPDLNWNTKPCSGNVIPKQIELIVLVENMSWNTHVQPAPAQTNADNITAYFLAPHWLNVKCEIAEFNDPN